MLVPFNMIEATARDVKVLSIGEEYRGLHEDSEQRGKEGRKEGRADTVLSTSTACIHGTNHASYTRSRSSDDRYGRLMFNAFLRLSAVRCALIGNHS